MFDRNYYWKDRRSDFRKALENKNPKLPQWKSVSEEMGSFHIYFGLQNLYIN